MMPGIAEYEIPRDLRDQREEKQVLSVFAAVPRVKEALDQKETEDREGRSADITDDAVPGDLCGTNGKEYPEAGFQLARIRTPVWSISIRIQARSFRALPLKI